MPLRGAVEFKALFIIVGCDPWGGGAIIKNYLKYASSKNNFDFRRWWRHKRNI
jgi:hypothetical protein